MTRKFWRWTRNETPDSFGSDRTLYLDGEISDETWYGDEVTPQVFKDELNSGKGNITLWINSPGGDVFAAAQIFPAQIVGILTPDPELIEKGVPFLRYYSIEYLFMAFSFCIGGLALGSGHPAISMLCALVSAVLLRVPLALLFSKTFAMGFNGIALGGALAPLGSVIAGAIFYFSGKWKQPSRGMEM